MVSHHCRGREAAGGPGCLICLHEQPSSLRQWWPSVEDTHAWCNDAIGLVGAGHRVLSGQVSASLARTVDHRGTSRHHLVFQPRAASSISESVAQL